MQQKRIIAVLFSLLIITGCTSEQLYDFGRDAGRNQAECSALISYDERIRCEEAFSKDYEQYKSERAALESTPEPELSKGQ